MLRGLTGSNGIPVHWNRISSASADSIMLSLSMCDCTLFQHSRESLHLSRTQVRLTNPTLNKSFWDGSISKCSIYWLQHYDCGLSISKQKSSNRSKHNLRKGGFGPSLLIVISALGYPNFSVWYLTRLECITNTRRVAVFAPPTWLTLVCSDRWNNVL